ncbi:hypothetical protein ASE95_07760 [Sphingomonas sp. Leaf231]|nr:hypothetical protein ASE95_07760 [Sphingomonas sp. Leaf231]
MAFMEHIAVVAPAAPESNRIVVRLLRHYCGTRDHTGEETALSRLVALGESLRIPPAGSVALRSVFQLAEAVLERRLVAGRCCSRTLNHDERAIIRLFDARASTAPGEDLHAMSHGLGHALSWAVFSARWLCCGIFECPPTVPSPCR